MITPFLVFLRFVQIDWYLFSYKCIVRWKKIVGYVVSVWCFNGRFLCTFGIFWCFYIFSIIVYCISWFEWKIFVLFILVTSVWLNRASDKLNCFFLQTIFHLNSFLSRKQNMKWTQYSKTFQNKQKKWKMLYF